MQCPRCGFVNTDTSRFCAQCAAPLTVAENTSPAFTRTMASPRLEFTRGTVFADRYRIIEDLGRGGMGAVYRVDDIRAEEEIALKIIRPEIAADSGAIDRFRNELKTARRIRHKNICGLYDLHECMGIHFITMEYVAGEDLRSFLRKSKRLSPSTALEIARQICDGLGAAHDQGVIHRDLKPANIMIDSGGDVRIMDFGIARSGLSRGETAAGARLGTPDYMSPEQAAGEKVDHRTDIYAFGLILGEMLTGGKPGTLDLDQAPAAIVPVLSKCLEADPERRYGTAREIRDQLRERGAADGPSKRRSSARDPSIAVLPFADMSARKDQEYFCDGLSESIINSLARIEACRVVARTSAFAFKGRETDIREIGKKLNVHHVLEGSVQKASKRLRITAQLISVKDGYHLWSERFDSALDDVFAIQDEISLQIVDKLKIKLGIVETRRLIERPTEDIEAYNLYLRGRYHWGMVTREGCEKALDYFHQVIARDPSFGAAYAGIAHCHLRNAWYYFRPPREEYPLIRRYAEKGMEIDDGLSEAHSALAMVNMAQDRDWAAAGRKFKRAAELGRNDSIDSFYYSVYCSALGLHEEAIRLAKKSLESDPISLLLIANLGMRYFYARQFDHSLAAMQKVIELNPYSYVSHWYSIYPLIYLEKYGEALDALRRAREIGGSDVPHFDMGEALVHSIAGDFPAVDKPLERLMALADKSRYSRVLIAIILIHLGRKDEAFDWLEKADREFDVMMIWIKSDPAFEKVAADPRYITLFHRMGWD